MKKIPPARRRRIRVWESCPGTTKIFPCNNNSLQSSPLIDLASNDYLALSRHPLLIEAAKDSISQEGVGAGASRLVTGTRRIHTKLEKSLGEWLNKERVFLFPSGFQANLAAVMSLANRHTNVIADKMIHNSLLMGIKASGAKLYRYVHNDLEDLQRLLTICKNKSTHNSILVITESLFSMEGSSPNIRKIAEISNSFNAQLLVDEAHALGIMGVQGKGLSYKCGDQVSIISGTFGKAFGSGGAFLACDNEIGEYLLQTSGAFRYTTALAPSLAAAALAALKLIQSNPQWGEELLKESQQWRKALSKNGWQFPTSKGPIISLILGSDENALKLENHLENNGIASIAIRPPTVPEGSSRVRLVLRRNLPEGTLNQLIHALSAQK